MVVYTRIFQSRVIPQIQFASWYVVTELPPTQNLNGVFHIVKNIYHLGAKKPVHA